MRADDAMPHALSTTARPAPTFPATTRLRAEILIAPDAERLVTLFADALAEHGIGGHFCLRKSGTAVTPLLGDAPELITEPHRFFVDSNDMHFAGARVLLAEPQRLLSNEEMTRIRGYAQLFAARALALQELADDVETDCGLSLRERYVLGRRLAGLAPVDIALEANLTVQTVTSAIDNAVARLGAQTAAQAIAMAARHGWLAVTSLQNCSSSSQNLTYKATQNG
jgi:DNA-binding CsgD family transcriptional regulator